MTVRAKFFVAEVAEHAYSSAGTPIVTGRLIRLRPVSSADPEHENRKFWDSTPSGMIELQINNNEAANQFIAGREYYVDFTPA